MIMAEPHDRLLHSSSPAGVTCADDQSEYLDCLSASSDHDFCTFNDCFEQASLPPAPKPPAFGIEVGGKQMGKSSDGLSGHADFFKEGLLHNILVTKKHQDKSSSNASDQYSDQQATLQEVRYSRKRNRPSVAVASIPPLSIDAKHLEVDKYRSRLEGQIAEDKESVREHGGLVAARINPQSKPLKCQRSSRKFESSSYSASAGKLSNVPSGKQKRLAICMPSRRARNRLHERARQQNLTQMHLERAVRQLNDADRTVLYKCLRQVEGERHLPNSRTRQLDLFQSSERFLKAGDKTYIKRKCLPNAIEDKLAVLCVRQFMTDAVFFCHRNKDTSLLASTTQDRLISRKSLCSLQNPNSSQTRIVSRQCAKERPLHSKSSHKQISVAGRRKEHTMTLLSQIKNLLDVDTSSADSAKGKPDTPVPALSMNHENSSKERPVSNRSPSPQEKRGGQMDKCYQMNEKNVDSRTKHEIVHRDLKLASTVPKSSGSDTVYLSHHSTGSLDNLGIGKRNQPQIERSSGHDVSESRFSSAVSSSVKKSLVRKSPKVPRTRAKHLQTAVKSSRTQLSPCSQVRSSGKVSNNAMSKRRRVSEALSSGHHPGGTDPDEHYSEQPYPDHSSHAEDWNQGEHEDYDNSYQNWHDYYPYADYDDQNGEAWEDGKEEPMEDENGYLEEAPVQSGLQVEDQRQSKTSISKRSSVSKVQSQTADNEQNVDPGVLRQSIQDVISRHASNAGSPMGSQTMESHSPKQNTDARNGSQIMETHSPKQNIDSRKRSQIMETHSPKQNIDSRKGSQIMETHSPKQNTDARNGSQIMETHSPKQNIDARNGSQIMERDTSKQNVDSRKGSQIMESHPPKQNIVSRKGSQIMESHSPKQNIVSRKGSQTMETHSPKQNIDARNGSQIMERDTSKQNVDSRKGSQIMESHPPKQNIVSRKGSQIMESHPPKQNIVSRKGSQIMESHSPKQNTDARNGSQIMESHSPKQNIGSQTGNQIMESHASKQSIVSRKGSQTIESHSPKQNIVSRKGSQTMETHPPKQSIVSRKGSQIIETHPPKQNTDARNGSQIIESHSPKQNIGSQTGSQVMGSQTSEQKVGFRSGRPGMKRQMTKESAVSQTGSQVLESHIPNQTVVSRKGSQVLESHIPNQAVVSRKESQVLERHIPNQTVVFCKESQVLESHIPSQTDHSRKGSQISERPQETLGSLRQSQVTESYTQKRRISDGQISGMAESLSKKQSGGSCWSEREMTIKKPRQSARSCGMHKTMHNGHTPFTGVKGAVPNQKLCGQRPTQNAGSHLTGYSVCGQVDEQRIDANRATRAAMHGVLMKQTVCGSLASSVGNRQRRKQSIGSCLTGSAKSNTEFRSNQMCAGQRRQSQLNCTKGVLQVSAQAQMPSSSSYIGEKSFVCFDGKRLQMLETDNSTTVSTSQTPANKSDDQTPGNMGPKRGPSCLGDRFLMQNTRERAVSRIDTNDAFTSIPVATDSNRRLARNAVDIGCCSRHSGKSVSSEQATFSFHVTSNRQSEHLDTSKVSKRCALLFSQSEGFPHESSTQEARNWRNSCPLLSSSRTTIPAACDKFQIPPKPEFECPSPPTLSTAQLGSYTKVASPVADAASLTDPWSPQGNGPSLGNLDRQDSGVQAGRSSVQIVRECSCQTGTPAQSHKCTETYIRSDLGLTSDLDGKRSVRRENSREAVASDTTSGDSSIASEQEGSRERNAREPIDRENQEDLKIGRRKSSFTKENSSSEKDGSEEDCREVVDHYRQSAVEGKGRASGKRSRSDGRIPRRRSLSERKVSRSDETDCPEIDKDKGKNKQKKSNDKSSRKKSKRRTNDQRRNSTGRETDYEQYSEDLGERSGRRNKKKKKRERKSSRHGSGGSERRQSKDRSRNEGKISSLSSDDNHWESEEDTKACKDRSETNLRVKRISIEKIYGKAESSSERSKSGPISCEVKSGGCRQTEEKIRRGKHYESGPGKAWENGTLAERDQSCRWGSNRSNKCDSGRQRRQLLHQGSLKDASPCRSKRQKCGEVKSSEGCGLVEKDKSCSQGLSTPKTCERLATSLSHQGRLNEKMCRSKRDKCGQNVKSRGNRVLEGKRESSSSGSYRLKKCDIIGSQLLHQGGLKNELDGLSWTSFGSHRGQADTLCTPRVPRATSSNGLQLSSRGQAQTTKIGKSSKRLRSPSLPCVARKASLLHPRCETKQTTSPYSRFCVSQHVIPRTGSGLTLFTPCPGRYPRMHVAQWPARSSTAPPLCIETDFPDLIPSPLQQGCDIPPQCPGQQNHEVPPQNQEQSPMVNGQTSPGRGPSPIDLGNVYRSEEKIFAWPPMFYSAPHPDSNRGSSFAIGTFPQGGASCVGVPCGQVCPVNVFQPVATVCSSPDGPQGIRNGENQQAPEPVKPLCGVATELFNCKGSVSEKVTQRQSLRNYVLESCSCTSGGGNAVHNVRKNYLDRMKLIIGNKDAWITRKANADEAGDVEPIRVFLCSSK